MIDNLNIINNRLNNANGTWKMSVMENFKNKNIYSEPFLLQADTGYLNGDKIIFYGQEPRGWDKTEETYIQAIRNYKPSPITMFFERFEYALMNNISKLSQYDKQARKWVSIDDNEAESQFSRYAIFDSVDEKTIYQHEIDILKPNKVILACGPTQRYINRLCYSFNLDVSIIEAYKPTIKNPVQDITELFNSRQKTKVAKKVLWTYHPGFLHRKHLLDSTYKLMTDK